MPTAMAFYGRESVSCSTFIFGNLQLMNSYKGNTEYAGVTVNESTPTHASNKCPMKFKFGLEIGS